MKLRTLRFHIEQGVRGMLKNGLMSLASIGIVAACIFIVIISLCVAINIESLLTKLETDVGVTIFIGDEPTEEQIAMLEAEIKQQPHITSVTYCSADDALERSKEMFGNAVVDGLKDDNPLPRSLEVSLEGIKYQESFVDYLEKLQLDFEKEFLDSIGEEIVVATTVAVTEATTLENTTAETAEVTQQATVVEEATQLLTEESLEAASEAVIQQHTSVADMNEGIAVGDMGYIFRGIEKIRHAEDIAGILMTVNAVTRIVSIVLLIILAIIAIAIIMNTIKLTVFIRKNEINIMKYVGATDWFIRWPFIIEGVIIGLVGAMLPCVVTLVSYDRLLSLMQSKLSMITNIVTPVSGMEIFPIIIPIALLSGALLGCIGSVNSIRKHLNV